MSDFDLGRWANRDNRQAAIAILSHRFNATITGPLSTLAMHLNTGIALKPRTQFRR